MFSFAAPRVRRRLSLTPAIDLVILILIFFMLVTRFGPDRALPVLGGAEADGYSGPPRLVEVFPDELRLNGVEMSSRALLIELVRISSSGTDAVVLRPSEGTSLQRLVDVMSLMESAGFNNLAMVEARQ